MSPSSRTPEGTPFHCPLCGNDVRIEFSCYPACDATCPHCGQLIQLLAPKTQFLLDRSFAHTQTSDLISEHDFHQEAFSAFDRRSWTALAVVSLIVVFANDGILNSAIWWLVIRFFATRIVPRIYQWGHARLDQSDGLYLGVILGWALVPGPLVGVLFGTILPAIYDCGLSSLAGGLIGLVLGPCFAVVQGLCIVGVIDGIFWLVTGHRIGNAT